jgi:hypothetical protein
VAVSFFLLLRGVVYVWRFFLVVAFCGWLSFRLGLLFLARARVRPRWVGLRRGLLFVPRRVCVCGALGGPLWAVRPRPARRRRLLCFRAGAAVSPVASAVSSWPVVGFSGSRALACASSAALRLSAQWVSPGAPVFVGCARGADALARRLFPRARVFRVSGGGRGAFAARSVGFVRALAASGGGLLSFPGAPCPASVAPSPSPSACFCGSGSGSWASLAFAVGLGAPCRVFLGSVAAPAWLVPVPGAPGWFAPARPGQLSLFG